MKMQGSPSAWSVAATFRKPASSRGRPLAACQAGAAAVYIVGSVALGLAGLFAGLLLMRAIL